MAGPTLSLLLIDIDDRQLAEISAYFLQQGELLEMEADSPTWELTLPYQQQQTTAWIQLVPFGQDREPQEVPYLTTAIGFQPAYELLLGMAGNHYAEHQLLARLAIDLLDLLGGLADLHGALVPAAYWTHLDWEHERESFKAAIRRFVATLPGRLWEIPYQVSAERQFFYHVVDAAFLQHWLTHPHFHLVK